MVQPPAGPDATARFPHLFSPFSLRGVTLQNRVVMLPMGVGLGSPDGAPSEDEIAFYERRAAAGVGLVVTGGTVVHETSSLRSQTVLEAFRRENIPGFAKLVGDVHRHGVPVFGQLMHRGSESLGGSVFPTWAPSPVPNAGGEVPHEMTVGEIDEIVEAYGRSAANLREAGYDGIEVHGAHGFLVAQFLSPRTNLRTDDYGGPLENRLRFALRVVDAVRQAIGDDLVVGFRLSAEEDVEDGLHLEESKAVTRALADTGQVDYLTVSIGAAGTYVRDMSEPTGLAARYSAALRSAADLPIVASQRITHPPLAEQMLERGDADLIGIGRALIADPDWPLKAADGHLDEILPCVGCVQLCRPPLGGTGCLHNPTAGHERQMPRRFGRAPSAKRVVVVGGGPAGMEAARVAAARGHHVVLFDRAGRLGGQVRIAANSPTRAEMDGVISFRETELDRLGVDVRLKTDADPDGIAAERPDAVVVATGSRPAPHDDVIGVELGRVVTDWDVLSPDGDLGRLLHGVRYAVVVDEAGGFWEAASSAEALAEAGVAVELVTAFPQVCHAVPFDSLPPLYGRLRRRDVTLSPMTALASVGADHVSLYDPIWLAARHELAEREVPAELVVLCRPRQVVDDLVHRLAGTAARVVAVGDCVAPRRIPEAIGEGDRIGRAL
ncbi:MAG TPA: FAD-dependent oxidoreductase [Acidimicrobiales bacterium]|nr:FAD-dependent oxidoreductase [Acidimicrobiales bacterium]